MKFKKMVIALDRLGCPNRCKHCWLSHTPNGHLTPDDLRFAAEQFRPFTDCLVVDDWYREPDYSDNYRAMWELCEELSDEHPDHFEVISVWRIARDESYAGWLRSRGLKAAQLTLFGGEAKTDYYTGRKGAYQDILKAIEVLLQHHIVPRIQVFINKDTLCELSPIEKLICDLRLKERCAAFGGEFSCFLHQGSCDGENEKLYDIRVTPDDLEKIPPFLAEYTLKHFQKQSIEDVFGQPEAKLYREMLCDTSTAGFVSDTPVFYIDNKWNVYPNVATPEAVWCLGNLKTDGAKAVLENYKNSRSIAQYTRLTVPLCELVKAKGDPQSQRLFTRGDYIFYLLNTYCRTR